MKAKTIQLTHTIPPTCYFVISSVLIYLGLYKGIPALMAAGVPFIKGYLVLFYLPFIFMFITALVLYRKEGNPWQLSAFKHRLNLTRLKRSDWFWILGIILVYLILTATTTPIMNNLAQHSFFSPPSFFPAEINPNKAAISGTMMDYSLAGQYWLPIVYFIGWFFNIFSEEFLWRGIILPRQVERFGTKAWLIHGLMWGLWHFFWKWQLVMLIPFALFFTFAVYKSKNTWVGIISHGALNAIPLIMIIIEVFR